MPRYFFHVRQGKDFVEDPEGVECTDSGCAKAEAIEGARPHGRAYSQGLGRVGLVL